MTWKRTPVLGWFSLTKPLCITRAADHAVFRAVGKRWFVTGTRREFILVAAHTMSTTSHGANGIPQKTLVSQRARFKRGRYILPSVQRRALVCKFLPREFRRDAEDVHQTFTARMYS